jgi:murein L,D-transpeptidase YafK
MGGHRARSSDGLARRALLAVASAALAVPWPAAAYAPADRVVVIKWQRRMTLLRGETVLREYRVALGRQPRGHKEREGDGRTPEGTYTLTDFNPRSAYHRSILIDYPNPEDRARAAARGVRPGGMIMIHGLDPGIRADLQAEHWLFNWTNGCIAVTNAEMDEIWFSVRPGTPIEILP